MSQQYEAGRKKHMAWHKSQNDPWSWHKWEVLTGPNTGSYVVGTFGHNWKDMEVVARSHRLTGQTRTQIWERRWLAPSKAITATGAI
jgi:hypothetical protein